MPLSSILRVSFVIALAFAVSSCSDVPVAEDLSDGQAREVVAALHRSGISSSFERERRGLGKYRVVVESGLFARAVDILDQQGLPEEPRDAFLNAISSNSFLPDSREVEALRLDFALGVQLESVLENMPGVVSARSVVRYHSAKFFVEDGEHQESEPVTASVVLLLSQSSDPALIDEESLERTIFAVVPGLKKENLHLVLHSNSGVSSKKSQAAPGTGVGSSGASEAAVETLLFGWRVAKEDYQGLVLTLLGFMSLFGVAVGFAGYWIGIGIGESRGKRPQLNGATAGDDARAGTEFQIEAKRKTSSDLPEVKL